jgi:SIR2-like protein
MRYRNKTVYLLGAGFSKPIGTPVLSDFVPEALRMLTEEAEVGGGPLRGLIKKLNKMLPQYMSASAHRTSALVNLEDLFCMVDLRKSVESLDLAKSKKAGRTSGDRGLLIELILRTCQLSYKKHLKALEIGDESLAPTVPRRYLDPRVSKDLQESITNESLNVCAYHAFLSQVLAAQKGRKDLLSLDAIITLNYDLLIESKLGGFKDATIIYGQKLFTGRKRVVGKSPVRCLNWVEDRDLPDNLVPLLKLHGSLNWKARDPETRTQLAQMTEPYADDVLKRKASDVDLIPLVPPTWRKGSNEKGIYERLMAQALQQLKTAGRIVIIGYSMPETDGYFRYLMAEAMCTPDPPMIEVWNVRPEVEMRERTTLMFGPLLKDRVRYESGGFGGFVQSFRSSESLGSV